MSQENACRTELVDCMIGGDIDILLAINDGAEKD